MRSFVAFAFAAFSIAAFSFLFQHAVDRDDASIGIVIDEDKNEAIKGRGGIPMESVERISDTRSLRLSSIVSQRKPVVVNRIASKWKAVGKKNLNEELES
jgi:hypothetical protein